MILVIAVLLEEKESLDRSAQSFSRHALLLFLKTQMLSFTAKRLNVHNNFYSWLAGELIAYFAGLKETRREN